MCALAKPIRPEYSATIPSTGKRIKYQPFSVKEEKILILASEANDLDEISNAIANVLNNCITTEGVDVNDLALFLVLVYLQRILNNVCILLHIPSHSSMVCLPFRSLCFLLLHY